MAEIDPVERLALELAVLPGVGKRSALRMAFHLLRDGPARADRLSRALSEAAATARVCALCGNLSAAAVCGVCSDPRRDCRLLLVTESIPDLRAVEATGEYRGLYHVLGGVISPLAGVGPEQLRIGGFVERLAGVDEVILALNPTVEGDSTAIYLARLAGERVGRVSRLGVGLPMGAELEYQDRWTLARALESRTAALI